MAGEFLNTHQFKSDIEKVIWEGHSQGFSAREIHHRFQAKDRKSIGLATLKKLLTTLSKEMLNTCLTKRT
jgi:Fe2+ or Zn2+ uptake regulation protein